MRYPRAGCEKRMWPHMGDYYGAGYEAKRTRNGQWEIVEDM